MENSGWVSMTLQSKEGGREEITVGEVLAAFGLDRLEGNFRQPEEPLFCTDEEGNEAWAAIAFISSSGTISLRS